jgi:penicillin-binding protein 1A
MHEPPSTLLQPDAPPIGADIDHGLPSTKPKLKKLRLAVILAGLLILALVSTVFGMMMAVASDLPQLETKAEYKRAKNSVVFADAKGDRELAKLTGNQNRILVSSGQISPNIKNAVIAIEDRRFYEHEGVDYQGIARAVLQDLRRQKAVQGGSTITQQFVKNALAAQGNRSVFQKLREAALAYHLERKWTKQRVLTQYLNSVYFGNGAYGVEAAVRTYFRSDQDEAGLGQAPGQTGQREEAKEVSVAEAALLAGMIASPSMYDPVDNPRRAKQRRDLVLRRMREEKMITAQEYRDAVVEPLPKKGQVDPPRPDSREPYFTSWLTQQLVDRYRAPAVFSGGLEVRSTLDPDLQAAAVKAIGGRLSGIGPSASLVAIENKTGEVKAMVGGTDFERRPFNLATNGHRQPGSAFKPFILVRALEDGVSPEATFTSQRKELPIKGDAPFVVRNYDDQYAGISSLRSATARSDNSVYAELGLRVGTKRVAALAERMGVRTRLSTNPAMTLGGLKEGVTPLEMAYAYSTIANKGVRVSGSLASYPGGPVAIEEVKGGGREDHNEKRTERVFPEAVGETAQQLLTGVVLGGTGRGAQIGEFAAGKTGTTENYGDAWFVGFNNELTVAVWVGYPDKLKYMETEYGGQPVAGGTIPTDIWHDLMRSWIGIRDGRKAASGKKDGDEQEGQIAPAVPLQSGPSTTPAAPGGQTTTPSAPKRPSAEPAPQKEPAPRPAPTPAPAPAPAPSPGAPGGGGQGGGGGAAPG